MDDGFVGAKNWPTGIQWYRQEKLLRHRRRTDRWERSHPDVVARRLALHRLPNDPRAVL